MKVELDVNLILLFFAAQKNHITVYIARAVRFSLNLLEVAKCVADEQLRDRGKEER
jgi:hypothetical protein